VAGADTGSSKGSLCRWVALGGVKKRDLSGVLEVVHSKSIHKCGGRGSAAVTEIWNVGFHGPRRRGGIEKDLVFVESTGIADKIPYSDEYLGILFPLHGSVTIDKDSAGTFNGLDLFEIVELIGGEDGADGSILWTSRDGVVGVDEFGCVHIWHVCGVEVVILKFQKDKGKGIFNRS